MATQAADRLPSKDNSVFPHAKTPIRKPQSGPSAEGQSSRDDVAAYLAKMTLELSAIARKADFELLAYFLEMARIEANGQVAKGRGDIV